MYGYLYAAFGLGAALGAITRRHVPRAPLEGAHRSPRARRLRGAAHRVRTARARSRSAFPVVAVLGFAYFMVITSLVDGAPGPPRRRVRGRVMALWIMSFGGDRADRRARRRVPRGRGDLDHRRRARRSGGGDSDRLVLRPHRGGSARAGSAGAGAIDVRLDVDVVPTGRGVRPRAPTRRRPPGGARRSSARR